MCQQITIIYTCGDTRSKFHPCDHALEYNIPVLACPFYSRETEYAADDDCSCPRCLEALRLRAESVKLRAEKEKAKRVCPSVRERVGFQVVSGPKTGGGANPDYPTILEEDDGAEAEAGDRPSEEHDVGSKGKNIDREEHSNYPRASQEGEEEYDNRPRTRVTQRERPVAEPRYTPLKKSKSKSLVRKVSDKVKQLTRSLSNKDDE